MPEPFDHLQMPRETAMAFVELFSRCEYCLKAMHYIRNDPHYAQPAWRSFATAIAATLTPNATAELAKAIHYLNTQPPKVQRPDLSWDDEPLWGANDVERAIDAACRVRNNLFHGGKYGPNSAPGRDDKLVTCATTLLQACLAHDPQMAWLFNHY